MGATVHLHYCMNEFVGWSLGHDKDDKCGKCGMEEKDKDGCCKDEHRQFKLKTDHQKAGETTFLTVIVAPAIYTAIPKMDFCPFSQVVERYSPCHAPPDIGSTRLHVLHGVFLV